VRALCAGAESFDGTTRGPGSSDSNPRPNARRFSANFSVTFSTPVFSAIAIALHLLKFAHQISSVTSVTPVVKHLISAARENIFALHL
jgi:energy-converting hydrogenase Eha subunit A